MAEWSITEAKRQALAESQRLRVEARAVVPVDVEPRRLSWQVEVLGCPDCGGPMTHVASGSPGPSTKAVAGCLRCGLHAVADVTFTVTRQLGRFRRRPHPDGCGCPPCAKTRARGAA